MLVGTPLPPGRPPVRDNRNLSATPAGTTVQHGNLKRSRAFRPFSLSRSRHCREISIGIGKLQAYFTVEYSFYQDQNVVKCLNLINFGLTLEEKWLGTSNFLRYLGDDSTGAWAWADTVIPSLLVSKWLCSFKIKQFKQSSRAMYTRTTSVIISFLKAFSLDRGTWKHHLFSDVNFFIQTIHTSKSIRGWIAHLWWIAEHAKLE